MSEPESMRINRYLARCGIGSRRAVEKLIVEGRVSIDGAQVNDLSARVAPQSVVQLDGAPVRLPQQTTLILFHKPPQTLCTAHDPRGRPTIYDLLPAQHRNLRYVGRLDWATHGLLLLTDNGELARRLTHPQWRVPRLYHAQLNRPMTSAEAHLLMGGVELPAEPGYSSGPIQSAPCDIRLYQNRAELLLYQGKNREVRRMIAHIGAQLLDLSRLAYGTLELGDLPPGAWRSATPNELQTLQQLVDYQEPQ